MVRINRSSSATFMAGILVGALTYYTISMTKNLTGKYMKDYTKFYEEIRDNSMTILNLSKSFDEPIDEKSKEHDFLSAEEEQMITKVEENITVVGLPEKSHEIPVLRNPSNNNITDRQSIFPESHACSLFGRNSIPSALSIWREHLSDVVRSSIHRQDSKHIWEGFTNNLLNYMTPERLQKSVKALPFQYWDNVGDVLDIVFKRWNWINSGRPQQDTEPRKVNIIVMGGSVTLGVLCVENPVFNTRMFARRECSWSRRLGLFLDAMTGKDLFVITNMAMGGSNTDSATSVWDYQLFPDNTPMPDIIVNAYSTNDMHVLSVKEAKMLNITLSEMVFQMNEKFIRSVLSTKSAMGSDGTHCLTKAPLLLYYDDYIGNEQKEIVQTLSFSRALNTLSAYYGFGFISYADAVRDLVYSNTNENWFSPTKWPGRQIHPGMGMHISSAWIFAFNFLEIATKYCEMPTALDGVDKNHYKPVYDEKIKDHPSPNPPALPPKLDHNLTLDDVSLLWQEAGNRNTLAAESEGLPKCHVKERIFIPGKCLFAWMGNTLDHSNTLTKKINDAVSENQDWKISSDHSKFGYLATQVNAHFVMKFTNINQPVIAINFFVMTSYGEYWEGSKIHVDAFVIPKGNDELNKDVVVGMDILGYHDKMTSEIFPYKLRLNKKAEIGDDLILDVRLTGGLTFKITGMAICNH